MIRIDRAWLATSPLDMRAGTDTALARVVSVFGAAHPHHAYLFANRRANRIKVLVHDARIMDALIIIDGFEHILDDGAGEGGGGVTSKLQIVLSRVMDILHGFHGCVCLLCHMENPQNIMLQR